MSELKSTNVDNILRGLGNPGRFQILQFLVLSFQYHSLAFNDYMPIFYGLPPEEIRCRESPFQEETPFFRIRSDHRGSDASSLRKLTNRTDVCKEGCPYGYEYIYPGNQWSIVADMDLICGRAGLLNLASISYFLGQIVATPFYGWAADEFGRRPILLLSNAIYGIMSLGLIFSRDYVSFAVLRFLCGVATQGMNSSFYVLLVEWMPPKHRGLLAAIAEMQYTFGTLVLAVFASQLQSWHLIQIFLSSYSTMAILLIWFAPESLSWCCLHNLGNIASSNCKKVAAFNGLRLSSAVNEEILNLTESQDSANDNLVKAYSFLDCFRTPYMFRVTLLCCFIWFACSAGNLGIPYMSSQIAANVYLNLVINASLEFVPIFLAAWIGSRFGNRLPLALYFFTGGLCALIAGVLPGTTNAGVISQNIMAFASRLCFVGTVCIIFVYTSELCPTVIRNNIFNLCSVALRLGSMSAPLLPLMSALYRGSGFVLAGSIGIAASGMALLLRETKGEALLSTMEETIALRSAGFTREKFTARIGAWSQLRMRRRRNPESSLLIPIQARAAVLAGGVQVPDENTETHVD